MPPKKRPPPGEQPRAKRTASDGDVLVILVSAPEMPVLDTFVVPLEELGADDRTDVVSMLAFGLTPDEAHFPTDVENPPTEGFPLTLYRLGLMLGVLSPADADDDPDRAWEQQLADRLAHTKRSLKVSYHGPCIGVLPLTCI